MTRGERSKLQKVFKIDMLEVNLAESKLQKSEKEQEMLKKKYVKFTVWRVTLRNPNDTGSKVQAPKREKEL